LFIEDEDKDMPRFKDYDYNQSKMIPVRFEDQILPGSFEYSLAYLIDHELDLSIFNNQFKNEEEGRPAYDLAILLKIIILAYSKGINTSRKIAKLCEENIIFMAMSADSHPHWTTIADFVSSSRHEIANLFKQVLMICDETGLIGKEMFAIDGCQENKISCPVTRVKNGVVLAKNYERSKRSWKKLYALY